MFCKYITEKLIKKPIASSFRQPAEKALKDKPSKKKYLDLVKNPMDLELILSNLNEQKYTSVQEWKRDMHLILEKCQKFNGEDHPLTDMAKELFDHLFNLYTEKIPETDEEFWQLRIAKKYS